jgi:hypothetical protein
MRGRCALEDQCHESKSTIALRRLTRSPRPRGRPRSVASTSLVLQAVVFRRQKAVVQPERN